VPAVVQERCAGVHVLPMRSFRAMAARSVLFGGSVGALQRARPASSRTVAALSQSADVTLLHGAHVAFLAEWVRGPVLLQVIDPWSSHASMEAEVAHGWLRLYRARQARQRLAAERELPVQARLLTVGRQDAELWSSRIGRSVGSIANGVDRPAEPAARPADRPPTVCFVGSLNYAPNVESAIILVRDIAPKVWADVPEARFVLAGRHPAPSVLALTGDLVDVRGNVPSVLEIFQAADVAVFPDRHGLGIRNSVSEALAAGLPVVASPTAAREQPGHPRLRIAEEADVLVELVREALITPGRWTAARDPSSEIRTWDTAAQEYHDELSRAVSRSCGS